jgi:hypothetical protein
VRGARLLLVLASASAAAAEAVTVAAAATHKISIRDILKCVRRRRRHCRSTLLFVRSFKLQHLPFYRPIQAKDKMGAEREREVNTQSWRLRQKKQKKNAIYYYQRLLF